MTLLQLSQVRPLVLKVFSGTIQFQFLTVIEHRLLDMYLAKSYTFYPMVFPEQSFKVDIIPIMHVRKLKLRYTETHNLITEIGVAEVDMNILVQKPVLTVSHSLAYNRPGCLLPSLAELFSAQLPKSWVRISFLSTLPAFLSTLPALSTRRGSFPEQQAGQAPLSVTSQNGNQVVERLRALTTVTR